VNEHLNDPEKAIAAYAEVGARAGGELGAKANLQVGRLRLQQKQPAEALSPLLTVAYAYDDVNLSPEAMCEAADALVQLNKPADARRLLERAVKDYPSSTWAATAKKQLGKTAQPAATSRASVAASVKGSGAEAELPPLVAGDRMAPPEHPQLVEGARRLVTPAPPLTPRIPNLLVLPRRSGRGSNENGQPAAPITTPPVNNVRGTSVLPLLKPYTREIAVEIAPPAKPLAFDRAPYVQAPGAEDDLDAPASAEVEGVRAKVD
jgi:hypothetical protein